MGFVKLRLHYKISLLETMCRVTCGHVLYHDNCLFSKAPAPSNVNLAIATATIVAVGIAVSSKKKPLFYKEKKPGCLLRKNL